LPFQAEAFAWVGGTRIALQIPCAALTANGDPDVVFMREDIIDRIDEAALLESRDIQNGTTTASNFIRPEISALHQRHDGVLRTNHARQSQPSAEASKHFLAGVVCRAKAGAGSGHNGATVRSGKGTKRSHDVRQCRSSI
jgi:hypothetical protein